jgi:YidC/Oxa1 family membrane protein insertase
VTELSPERRALLAFLLSIIVLFVWGKIYKPSTPPRPSQTQKTPQTPQPAEQPASSAPSAPAGGPATAIRASEEKAVVIESLLYRVELSNRGGVARSWQLKKYLDDSKPPHPLDLVNAQAAQQVGGWPLSLALADPNLEAEANSALYRITPSSETLQAPAEVKFEWGDGHLQVTKRLKFAENYLVEIAASVTLNGRPVPVAIAWRGGFGDTTVYQAAQQVNLFYQLDGKLVVLPFKKLGVSGNPSERSLQPGTLGYAGIEDQFFTAAFLPNGPGLNLWHWGREHDVVVDGNAAKEPVAEMAAGSAEAAPLSLRVYVGPKALDQLNAQQPPLEGLVQFGWTGVIAKPLFDILKWIHHYVPNYGWAIVILTLAINTALFPLKMKSWRSMQKMQRVGPRVEAIKQRYAKYSLRDPRKRKMNEEVMELYRAEGINPMGSCLPMLLQMPIWWSLYRMLQGVIELRHAPWIGWIHDLSAHDPYYILPILMTITMYTMQKMTPTTAADPTQQKMMTLMPLMFGVLFFRLSSGLILYIFTSNLVGMAQQWYLNRTEPLPAKGSGAKKR